MDEDPSQYQLTKKQKNTQITGGNYYDKFQRRCFDTSQSKGN